jgi:hypothetical protein
VIRRDCQVTNIEVLNTYDCAKLGLQSATSSVSVVLDGPQAPFPMYFQPNGSADAQPSQWPTFVHGSGFVMDSCNTITVEFGDGAAGEARPGVVSVYHSGLLAFWPREVDPAWRAPVGSSSEPRHTSLSVWLVINGNRQNAFELGTVSNKAADSTPSLSLSRRRLSV